MINKSFNRMGRYSKNLLWVLFLISFLLFNCSSEDEITSNTYKKGPLIIDNEPSWSPDGRTIAYYHNSDLQGIYLVDTSGNNNRLLINIFNEYVFAPDWSPDGNWIAFCYRGHIYKIKSNGDSLTKLTYQGNNVYPSWSSDNQWIVFESNNDSPEGSSSIWKMKYNGSEKVKIINPHEQGSVSMPDLSHSSNYIACLIYEYLPNFTQDIAIYYNNGTLHRILTIENSHTLFPKFSPDDSKILFTERAISGLEFQLYEINVDGSNLRRLTDTQGCTADYSPDGQCLVYCDSRPDNGKLWIMNINGSGKRQLTF